MTEPWKDPVCGMTVKPESPHHYTYRSVGYHFCSANCLAKFQASPDEYVGARPAQAPVASGTTYTCPMHPEVRQPSPGTCPKCGIKLEPESPKEGGQP